MWCQVALGLLVACSAPCPPVPVQLPEVPTEFPWLADQAAATTGVRWGGVETPMSWDTGFRRTSLGLSGQEVPRREVVLELGAGRAGPLEVGWMWSEPSSPGVLGYDVLSRLPVVFDARARTQRVEPAFSPPRAPVVLHEAFLADCRGGQARAPLPWVELQLGGALARLILDTGADLTFVDGALAEAVGAGPVLEGVPISSGFAGAFVARAVRVEKASVGEARVERLALLSAPEVDQELERLGQGLRGFLGWNFLREFEVALNERAASGDDVRLGLRRFDTQVHWERELVGVGLRAQRVSEPSGWMVVGHWSRSPARDAGVRLGEVVTAVDGVPGAPLPRGPVGRQVTLSVWDGASTRQVPVELQDLLPDS